MPTKAEKAVAEFAKGLLTYVADGNVIELHECGFVQELQDAIAAGGLTADDDDDDDDTEEDEDDEEIEEPISYRYVWTGADQVEDIPLLVCPACGGSLTAEGGINLCLSIAGQETDVESRLDGEGRLEDTEDDAVAKGFHSETRCGHCFESLTAYEEEVF